MPKKFTGGNSKALAVKERTKENRKPNLSLKPEENEYAKDGNQFWKIQQKKERELLKKQDKLVKKAKAKVIPAEELKSIKPKVTSNHPKLTRAEIEATSSFKPKPEKYDLIEENLNTLPEVEYARNIDQAISILSNDKPGKDRNPEKRMKAGHLAYEERRLKELKLENPKLRLSKMREIIFKEWKIHPDNPLNKL